MRRTAKSSLVVSSRGQVTLPADIRKKLGIFEGGVVTVEAHGGELILRPAAVLEIEVYSDEQIGKWDKEDQLSDRERASVRKRLAKDQ